MSTGQADQQFWSIERAVAFVVAPVVTPLSGALALWLGKHFPGAHVSSTSIAAFASTTALGVAGGFIKWLDGRQKFVAQLGAMEHQVSTLLPAGERDRLLGDVSHIVKAELSSLRAVVQPGDGALDPTKWPRGGDPADSALAQS